MKRWTDTNPYCPVCRVPLSDQRMLLPKTITRKLWPLAKLVSEDNAEMRQSAATRLRMKEDDCRTMYAAAADAVHANDQVTDAKKQIEAHL